MHADFAVEASVEALFPCIRSRSHFQDHRSVHQTTPMTMFVPALSCAVDATAHAAESIGDYIRPLAPLIQVTRFLSAVIIGPIDRALI